jgi:hypothetical protein
MIGKRITIKKLTYTITLKQRSGGEWHIGFIKGPFLNENVTGIRSINRSRRNAIGDLLLKASQRIFED